MGRKKVGDDIWSGYIIELYQLVVYEILDTVPQMVTFFKGMPSTPKWCSHFLDGLKLGNKGPSLGL